MAKELWLAVVILGTIIVSTTNGEELSSQEDYPVIITGANEAILSDDDEISDSSDCNGIDSLSSWRMQDCTFEEHDGMLLCEVSNSSPVLTEVQFVSERYADVVRFIYYISKLGGDMSSPVVNKTLAVDDGLVDGGVYTFYRKARAPPQFQGTVVANIQLLDENNGERLLCATGYFFLNP